MHMARFFSDSLTRNELKVLTICILHIILNNRKITKIIENSTHLLSLVLEEVELI